MRAVVMEAPGRIVIEDIDAPKVLDPTDAVIELAATCICGSDLWPFRGAQPVDHQYMGHEYIGEVVETGPAVKKVVPGDFVVGSFCISCGECEICRAGYPSRCPVAAAAGDPFIGTRSNGTQAEFARVPFADGTLVKTPAPPSPELIPHLLAAAKAGKAVLCEKPIALDMADVEAAREELDAVTTPVMFGFNRRFDPSFAALRAAVADGRVGDLENLLIISRDPAAPPVEYVKVSGGIFRDMTIHDFDMARFFLGDIVEVHAFGQNFDPGIAQAGDFDAAVVTLRNADGVVATIINNRKCSAGYDQRLEAQGSTGTLNADNMRATTVRLSNGEATDAAEPYLDFFLQRYADAYRLELTAFIDAVAAGRTPPTSITDAVEALRLAEAATESARTGRAVTL